MTNCAIVKHQTNGEVEIHFLNTLLADKWLNDYLENHQEEEQEGWSTQVLLRECLEPRCAQCGTIMENDTNGPIHCFEEDLKELYKDYNWKEVNNKAYCPQCLLENTH